MIQEPQAEPHTAQSRSATIAIACRGLVKEFGKGATRIRVLHGVDLDVPFGEMTFVVGPSGCGKTTLISIIAGLLTPEAGQVKVLGQALETMSSGQLVDFRRDHIGFIFQQFNLLPALTAAENAAVALLAQDMAAGPAVCRAGAMLEKLGIGSHRHKLPSQMSGGQQQRVAIARALVHQPPIIICDEPTASLDAHTGQTVLELLREIAVRPDSAVIIVTHDNRIFSFADRIVHMSDGQVEEVEITSQTNPTPAVV